MLELRSALDRVQRKGMAIGNLAGITRFNTFFFRGLTPTTAENLLHDQLERLRDVGIHVGYPLLGNYRTVREALMKWSFLSSQAQQQVTGVGS